ncbi:MAG: tetratricopeptide repeat protein [Planctomycetales bacterium]|nr:tetratricopeptide repeat protein [Planctomycetales bacterium]
MTIETRRLLIIATFSLIVSGQCWACLWDYDTLAMERQRFPDAHELIAGHFVRHSPEYYKWRISDRTSKPVDQRTPIDFDDIAVAYDRLGQHDAAIDTIRAKVERWPDERRYESEANLGTFHIHAGRFEEGLHHINKAIEINPDAHFGREIYQKLLVEYVIESQNGDHQLPLNDGVTFDGTGFAAFVLAARKAEESDQPAEIQAAAKGILGMMRFGNHNSPILLEALGDLLLYSRDDSKMLAARAYLRASYEAGDSTASVAYRQKAQQAVKMQFGREIAEVEADLKTEIEQGKSLFRQISDDEQAWIVSGRNLDVEFGNKYYEQPPLELNRPDWKPMDPVTRAALGLLRILAAVFVGCGLVGVIAIRLIRRKKNRAT